MAITKIQSESLNLADTYAFTGTVTGAGGVNTPAFEAYISGSTQVITNGTLTKIQFNTEVFDDGSCYDNSTNYRFTVPSGEAGTYTFYTHLNFEDNQNTQSIGWTQLAFYKNGSNFAFWWNDNGTAKAITSCYDGAQMTIPLVAGDYIEVYAAMNQTNTNNPSIGGYSNGNRYSVFGGHKVIR